MLERIRKWLRPTKEKPQPKFSVGDEVVFTFSILNNWTTTTKTVGTYDGIVLEIIWFDDIYTYQVEFSPYDTDLKWIQYLKESELKQSVAKRREERLKELGI
jgi:hypothetical protein